MNRGRFSLRPRVRTITIALLAGGAVAAAAPAYAAGTKAGTTIENIATATYDGPDGLVEVPSNPVEFIVDEILDVTVVSEDPGDITVQPGATNRVLTFTVTNTGNGNEAFTLTADAARGGDDFDPSLVSIVIDSDGDGVYSPGTDTIYVAGSNDPLLDPDESITVFILVNIPGGATDGNRAEVNLLSEAVTGTGAPGTAFAGQGDGGGDAVVGTTGADDDDSGFLIIRAVSVDLVKSAVIADPFGGDSAVPGSIITYSLVATVSGTGTLNNLAIADNVPDGTTYVAESITLEGAGLSDASDSDAGSYDGSAIAVSLGNVDGGQTRTVTFQVEID